MALNVVSAGMTDAGRTRKHNEDAFLDAPDRGLWVVADGMGGHTAGDVASAMIVQRIGKLGRPADPLAFIDTVEAELLVVNAELRIQARERNVGLIGATVVTLMTCGDFMVCGWAGDSRAYRYRAGKLQMLSRDHSMNQEMLDTGQFTVEMLKGNANTNAITRAVGGEEGLYVDWIVAEFMPSAEFLICTDGLTKELSDARLEEEFARQLPPAQTARNLVQAALEHGGRDNVTAVVVSANA